MKDQRGPKMQRDGYLFDDSGIKWSSSSLELRRRLFCVNYPGDLATDVIRNLGFIGASGSSHKCHIRVFARSMSEPALIAVGYWLSDNQFKIVTIDYLDEDRHSETVIGWQPALNRLLQIQFHRELQRRVRSRHYELTSIGTSSDVFPVAEYWKFHNGQCTPESILDVANRSTNGRYVHIERDDSDTFVVAGLGKGLLVPEPNWADQVLGRPVGSTGDSYYYSWVKSTYDLAWKSGRPDVAEIEAAIMWPSSGIVQRHYERLLLPCVTPNGRRFLITANGRPGGEVRLSKVG